MSESGFEDQELGRYVIEVEAERAVVLDTAWPESDRRYVAKVYAGPNRLSDAIDYSEKLNARVAEWDGLTIEEADRVPAEDATVTQPLPSLAEQVLERDHVAALRPRLRGEIANQADEFLENLNRRLAVWNENRPADRVPLAGWTHGERLAQLSEPTPAEFLSKTLPAYARRQRLESMLVEVTDAETEALALLAEDMTELNRAVALRRKLEKLLETCTSPSGSTESAQNDSVVLASTLAPLRNVRASLYGLRTARGISKPGPY